MTEPSSEFANKMNESDRWIGHGAIELYYQSTDERVETPHKQFLCRSLINNKEARLSASEMALVVSIDPDNFKPFEEIAKDYKKWLNDKYRELEIHRETGDLTPQSFYVLKNRVEAKLGGEFTEHAINKWKIMDAPPQSYQPG